jgi:hypothetical protein
VGSTTGLLGGNGAGKTTIGMGNVWPESERALWLELLKGSFKLIYKDDDKRTMVQANLRSLSGKDEAAN